MVKAFGAEVQQSNDPSYIGYSKEGDADKTLKTLFSGVANLIDLKSNYWEEKTKDEADSIAEKEVAGVTEGESSETLIREEAATTPSTADADAKNLVTSGSKLRQAYEEGRITESYYWSQMEAKIKTLKARYPGEMGRRIEASIKASLGANPAARATEAKRDEYKSKLAVANESEKAFAQEVKENQKFLPVDYWQRMQAGNPYTMLETRAYITDQKQMDLKDERRRASLAEAVQQGNLTEEKAVGSAIEEVTGYTNRILTGTADTEKQFSDLLKKAQTKGKDFSPDEQMALRQAFANLRFKVAEGTENILGRSWPDNKSTYYNQIKSPEKIRQIRETAMARIDQLEKYINDKDFGLLNADINRTKALKDEANRAVLESSDTIRIMQAAKDAGAGDLLNSMLFESAEGAKLRNSTVKALRDIKLASRMAGESVSLSEDMRDASKLSVTKKEKNQLNFQLVKDSIATITSPQATPDVQSNTARYLFGPKNADFLSTLKADQRTQVYTRLVSPEMTKTMLKVKEHDQEAWNQYRQWAVDSFGSLFRDLAAGVSEGITQRPWIDVKWDGKQNQFVVSTTEQGRRQGKLGLTGLIPKLTEGYFTASTNRTIDEFNRQIKALEPILKADNYEMGEELLGLMNQMGIDAMAPKDASFWGKLRTGLSDHYKEEQGGDRTDANGKK